MSKAATKAGRPALTPLERQGKVLGLYLTLPAQLLLLFIVAFPLVMQLYVSFTWWGPLDGLARCDEPRPRLLCWHA